MYTVGHDTRTYPVAPDASSAANFLDFLTESFTNGFSFAFTEDNGAAAGAESDIGLLGIGGASVGEANSTGATAELMFLLRCISKSPI